MKRKHKPDHIALETVIKLLILYPLNTMNIITMPIQLLATSHIFPEEPLRNSSIIFSTKKHIIYKVLLQNIFFFVLSIIFYIPPYYLLSACFIAPVPPSTTPS